MKKQVTETKRESHRNRTLIGVTVLLAVAAAGLLAAALVFALRPAPAARANANAIENVYQRNFYDLADSMSEIELRLDKLTVATGGAYREELADDLWSATSRAAIYLDALPIDHHSIEATFRFVNQLGDYVHVVVRTAGERPFDAAELAELERFYGQAKRVNASLEQLRAEMRAGYRFLDHIDTQKLVGDDRIGDALTDKESASAPSLIYDGPFSDACANPDYSALEKLKACDKESALAFARQKFGSAEYLGLVDTTPAAHTLRVGDDGYLQLTVRGCLPMTYAADCARVEPELQQDDATEVAVKWAGSVFEREFDAVWFSVTDGIATVNLAPVDHGAAYYTELVKIKVNLSDGKICGVDSLAYLANLTRHRTFEAKVNREAAVHAVSTSLAATYSRLAVVPRPGGGSTLAHEFYGHRNGHTYIAYVDALTGAEIDLMRVADTDQGTLVR